MNKRLLLIVGLLGISVGSLFATTSYFRTPLSFLQKPRTYVHYPLFPIDECDDWIVDAFGVYYQRNACDAFGCPTDCIIDECAKSCDTNNDTTTNTVPLSELWFGKSEFKIGDAFPNGDAGDTGNPFVNFATLKPQFGYDERGVALGITVNRYNLGCDKTWFVSGRVALPIKRIEVNQRRGCGCEERADALADAIVTFQQQFPGESPMSGDQDTKSVRAYRLDFLGSLKQDNGDPMIDYGTVTGDVSGNTRVAGQDISDNDTQSNGGALRAPMYVYKQSSGKVPFPPQGLELMDVSNGPPLGQDLMIDGNAALLTAAGNGALANGQWARFGGFTNGGSDNQANYAGGLGSDPAAQRQLFLVPVQQSSSPAWEEIGLVVQNTIDRVVEDLLLLDEGAVDYLASKGVDFGRSDCSTGAGDTFIDVWGGRMCDCWFADAVLGFRLPTGTDADPKRIYQQTTGNNGHFATKLGVEGGYKPCDWLGAKVEFFWRHNFNATEKRAAAFRGATVKNIGPCLDARVNWDDFQLYIDFTFFSQRCPNLGWDVGYEFYAKTKDDVCFCSNDLQAWNGTASALNPRLLEENTDTQAHKVRAEIFNEWGCFQLFFGGAYNFAGKNVMKEALWYLGMKAYF